MKVALVYDRVNKFGGAERLLLALHRIFPAAPLYTLVHHPATAPWAGDFTVIPSFFNNLKWLRARHELLAPVAAMAFESFNFDNFDVVISITSADAKAVITKPQTLHLCYCLTPTRYLWSGQKDYQNPLLNLILPKLQERDYLYAQRPDAFLSISKEVQNRIRRYYQRDNDVVYPPIDYEFFAKAHSPKQDFYLVVSRLVPYKKTDLLPRLRVLSLKVVGTGSQWNKLRRRVGSNVQLLGQVSDDHLRQLYASAAAVIFPQLEDFGLVPLEAQAAGTPVLAFRAGGALETVVEGQTGLFFDQQTPDAIINAIRRFEAGDHQITAAKCRQQAKRFSLDNFIINFSAKVDSLWQRHQKSLNI